MMNISILTNPVAGGWSPWDTRLGGSEESYVEWAVHLAKRGHNVTVYHNGKHGNYSGVDFCDRSDYKPGGVTLNCNYPTAPVVGPTIYFNNLVDASAYNFEAFQEVVHPSNYAREHVGITHPRQTIVPHGYDSTTIYYNPEEKVPHTVLYASSPDRGLSELEKVWPQVVEKVPDAQLLVTYDGHILGPNVIHLGSVNMADMADLFVSSDIWCHPALGGELFGMSGVKAQVAGCWPVYYPTMALTETVKYGTTTNPSDLAGDLVTALQGHPEMPKLHFADWDESTDLLEKVLQKYA